MTGSYVIEASGASGASGTNTVSVSPFRWKLGGLGAKITGTFQINEGTKLKILVGQEGTSTTADQYRPGGGGGGSFVTLLNDTPLIVAGGGGGGGAKDNFTDGDPGQATRNGSQCGGTQGGGGKACVAVTSPIVWRLYLAGGAGIRGDGIGISVSSSSVHAPRSFITGGTGGQVLFNAAGFGGFGGGSFALSFAGLGGGGGGYSGGGVLGEHGKRIAGGGGSYNVGKNQQNVAGANKGDGKVVIALVNP